MKKPLFLSLYFPYWATDLYRKRRSKQLLSTTPILLTRNKNGQCIVARPCRYALEQGVEPETPLALAEALLDQAPRHAPWSVEQDFKALYKTALNLLKFSPLVGLEKELVQAYRQGSLLRESSLSWGVVINLSGTSKLYGDYKNLIQKIHTKFQLSGIHVRSGIATTSAAAWSISRFARTGGVFLNSQKLRERISLLPIQALRISAETEIALLELGLFTVQDVQKLPRKKLLGRFGLELLERIDQLLGYTKEQVHYVNKKESFERSRSFEFPLNKQSSIHLSLLSLLKQVIQELRSKGRKAGSFVLSIQGEDACGESFQLHKEISLNSTSHNPAHISSVLEPIVCSLTPPGGVTELQVQAHTLEKFFPAQTSSFSTIDTVGTDELDEFINSVTMKLGNKNVCSLELHETHTPEKSYSFTPIRKKHRKSISHKALFPPLRFHYPSQIFSRPEAVETIALLPDKPPSQITWKGHRLPIRQSAGPERITAEWWEQNLSEGDVQEREYFRVQDSSGRWLWIYRNRASSEWFIHGIWA